jgi:DeoR family transcriptional regulator, aga operon transcriptional repressor
MSRYERWNAILDLLAKGGSVTVEEVAAQVGVSAATIRRDFDQLDQQQMLTRTRGGAVANTVSYDLPLRYKTARHASEKQRIGLAAAAMVPAGATVGLNGGTTTIEVARALATRADLHDDSAAEPAVTVVTNALNIASELVVRPHVKIVVTGGVARPQSYELTGPLATPLLNAITLDYIILGVDGIDPDKGASTHDEGEARINQLMAEQAAEVVVVADSSKLGVNAFARICGVRQISVLVTDTDAPSAMVSRFEQRNIRVVTA